MTNAWGRRPFILGAAVAAVGLAKSTAGQKSIPGFTKFKPVSSNVNLGGKWLYRSLRNSNDPLIDPAKLPLLIAVLEIAPYTGSQFSGTLTATANSEAGVRHTIKGESHGDRFLMRATEGSETTAGWVYDYEGWIVPQWENASEQIQTFVGSVIRLTTHPTPGGGISNAGGTYTIIGTKMA